MLFRLTCRRGAFPLLPNLGSRLYLLGREAPSAREMAAWQYAREALEDLELEVTGATVQLRADGAADVAVTLVWQGQTLRVEVTV